LRQSFQQLFCGNKEMRDTFLYRRQLLWSSLGLIISFFDQAWWLVDGQSDRAVPIPANPRVAYLLLLLLLLRPTA